jgi:hypothetical protein
VAFVVVAGGPEGDGDGEDEGEGDSAGVGDDVGVGVGEPPPQAVNATVMATTNTYRLVLMMTPSTNSPFLFTPHM